MTERAYRIIGGVRIGPHQAIWCREGAGDPWTRIELYPTGPGVFYPTTNDEAFDLKLLINDALISAAFNASFNFRVSGTYELGDHGATELYIGSHPRFEISSREDGGSSLTDNSDNVWAILFPQLAATNLYSLTITDDYIDTRAHGFSLYPRRYFLKDVTAHRFRASQNASLGGRANTNFVSRLLQPMIDVRLVGSYPRALVINEYHQLSDFLALAATGMPVLVYPDRTVYTPYAELTNPYGWWRGVLLRDSGDFDPQRADGEWFANWHKAMTFQNIGEP